MQIPFVIPGFDLREVIGEGATSQVWRATQRALERDVAIKVITTTGASGARRAERLVREARLAGTLDHPGIVRGIAAGEGQDFAWFAMELVRGETLEARVARTGALDVAAVIQMGIGLAEALAHAHAHGVIHRDVKPSNIMLEGEHSVPRLLDLGLARHDDDPTLTRDGGALGTPHYMAPEQARDPSRVGPQADVFALAATLFYALTGRPPFAGRTVAEVLTALLYEDPPSLTAELGPSAESLEGLLRRAFVKDPYRRLASMREFAAALAECLQRPDQPAVRRGSWWPRAALVVGLVAAATWAFVAGSNSPLQPPEPGTAVPEASASAAPEEEPVRADAGESIAPSEATLVAPAPTEAMPSGARSPAELLRAYAALDPATPEAAALADAWLAEVERAAALARASVRARLERTGDLDATRTALAEQRRGLTERLGQGLAEGPEFARTAFERTLAELDAEIEAALRTRSDAELARALEALRQARAELVPLAGDRLRIETALDQILGRASSRVALEPSARAALDAARAALVSELSAAPHERWAGLRDGFALALSSPPVRVQAVLDALELEAPQVRALGLSAELEWDGLRQRALAIADSQRAEAAQMVRAALAQAPWPRAEFADRGEALRRGLEQLAADPADIPGLAPLWAEGQGIAELLSAAGKVRPALERALFEFEPKGEALLLAGRKDAVPELRRWTATERRRDGLVLVLEQRSGPRGFKVDDLAATDLEALAEVMGVAMDRAALVALAHGEGAPLLAAEIATMLPAGDREDRARNLAVASLTAFRAGLGSEAERAVVDPWAAALRAIGAGDLESAEAAFRGLASDLEAGRPRGAIWRAEARRALALAEGVQAAAQSRAALEGFLPHRAPAEEGAVRIVLAAGDARLRSLLAPPGAPVRVHDLGLEFSAEGGPSSAAPWRIQLPGIAGTGRLSIELILRPSGPEWPPFLTLGVGSAHLLALGDVIDPLAARARSLHGLERGLLRRERVRAAAALGADLEGWMRGYPRSFAPFSLLGSNSESPARIRLRISIDHDGVRITAAEPAETLRLAAGLDPDAPIPLSLRAPSGVVIEGLTVEAARLPGGGVFPISPWSGLGSRQN